MRRSLIPFALLVALAAMVATDASARADEGYREIHKSFPFRAGQAIEIDFPIGQLRIEAGNELEVAVELEARCRWRSNCGLEKVEIDHRSSDRTLRIDVRADGLGSKTQQEMKAVMRVPPGASLDVEMSIGELEIRDLEGDLEAELGIGEVRVYASAARVRAVYLDAGIGEAALRGAEPRARSARSMLVGGEVEWAEGEGDATLDVEVGIGEVRVDLD